MSLPGFLNKHVVTGVQAPNPLPHARKAAPKDQSLDPTVAGWKHNANYTCFFNAAARALTGAAGEARLQVRLLFGTGSEYYRHGVCGAVEGAAQPILLIVITGIEPQYPIEFWDPADPTRKQTLVANNRWGVGITDASIEAAISGRYGRVIDYAISVCAAFSTGYLGLQGSVAGSLFSLSRLERVVIYDCLYGTLRPALDRVKAARPSAHVIAYVVTEGGNSFQSGTPASFATLSLGGIAGWNYIDLMGNTAFHTVTSARLVDEARRLDALVLNPLRADDESALNGLVAVLPARNTMVSGEALCRKVKGSLPAGSTVLQTFGSAKANASLIRNFSVLVWATRRCIGRGRLLGWATPPGEEWHDMLLIEFAWEYLT